METTIKDTIIKLHNIANELGVSIEDPIVTLTFANVVALTVMKSFIS